MKLDSVREFKRLVSDEVVAAAGDTPEARSFYAATEPPMPAGVALGIAKNAGEHLVAIRTADPAAAEKLAARANGEADVRIITVSKRTTAGYFQGTLNELEPGAQVNIKGAPFVGTLGCFVRDAAGKLYALSNSHVLADEGRTPIGTVIGQPFGTRPTGVLARFIPFSKAAPNLVDVAMERLDHTAAVIGFDAALLDYTMGRLHGWKDATPNELGVEVVKAGRTTGVRRGKVTAVEIDGLPVAYDQGILHFNDQIEVSGGSGPDFSAPGDSGSLIVRTTGYAIALLFAGGKDQAGEDRTYGNRIGNVLGALGVDLA